MLRGPRWVSRQLGRTASGQDRLGITLHDGALFAALCDGAGGMPGGDRAADLAVSWLLRALEDDPGQSLLGIDQRLASDPLAGETTAVWVRLDGRSVAGMACGDSAAFLDGVELTWQKHRKLRLGSGRVQPVGFSGEGVRLLLCSDGLTATVDERRIASAMSEGSLDAAADALVEAGTRPAGSPQDDLTFLLVDAI